MKPNEGVIINEEEKVALLLDKDIHGWDLRRIEDKISDDLCRAILSIAAARETREDQLVWPLDRGGSLIVKTADISRMNPHPHIKLRRKHGRQHGHLMFLQR